MWLRLLQRVVRLSPGLLGRAWAVVPEPVRRALGPLVHPIAVGPRSPGHVLVVPTDGRAAAFDVVVAPHALTSPEAARALAELAAEGHRVVRLAVDERLVDVARRQSIVDAVYVGSVGARPGHDAPARDSAAADDPSVRDAQLLGFRCVAEDELATVSRAGAIFPEVTIIVVTYGNRELCRSCLAAVRRSTPWPGLEVIVVDNGGADGTASMLEEERARDPRLSVITNATNLGFARATNQALRRARGEIVVLLNDDTAVAPGWLSRLVRHLEADPRLALVCPVTNQIGSDAKVPVPYSTFDEMEAFAVGRAFDHAGRRRATETVALFCAAARRGMLESVGFLDERYEVGMFEDDDLSLALRRRGLALAVAEDAFVHHVGQASFARLSDSEYLKVWVANRRRFERKWGVRWRPPQVTVTP